MYRSPTYYEAYPKTTHFPRQPVLPGSYPIESQDNKSNFLYIILIISLIILLIGFVPAWISSRKIGGTYLYLRREHSISPSVEEANELDAQLAGSKLEIELGMIKGSVKMMSSDGVVFREFIGDIPNYGHSDIYEVDPVTKDYLTQTGNISWSYEYKRYNGGQPNLILTKKDKDGQFISKFIYKIDLPLTGEVGNFDMSDHPEWTKKKM